MEPFLKKRHKPAEVGADPYKLVLHPEHMDDLLLWRSFLDGDEKALVTIFDRFSRPMYNYGYKVIGEKELVKDAIQDLFIEIWQNRARLGNTDSIKFYLFKSLRRKLLRTKIKMTKRSFAILPADYNGEVSPSRELLLITEEISSETRNKVMVMLNKLTKRQQEAIFLRYFEDLNCDQIAAVMELSKQAVYNVIHHAMGELRKQLHS